MKPRTILRAFTGDRGPPSPTERVEIHTREQIGPNMSVTPAGFLLCKNVPIARVGWMIYGPDETPIAVSKTTGLAHVNRTADDLFHPDCVGSFMGSPIVDEHPDPDDYPDGVTPSSWKKLGKGFSLSNVRRGEGRDEDVLLADILVTDADLIASIQAGKREVSCGYDADYEQTGDGEGRQFNIIGNHIALVEKGRCGPRCAIGDRAHQPEGNIMATQLKKPVAGIAKRRAVLDARRKVLDAETELQNVEEADQGVAADDEGGVSGSGDTHIHIHGPGGMGKPTAGTGTDEEDLNPADPDAGGDGDDRIGKLETAVAAITESMSSLTEVIRKMSGGGNSTDGEPDDEGEGATEDGEPDDDEDAKKKKEAEEAKSKTMDSAALATSYAKVQSQAEILVPGFRMATFDAKSKRASTVDAMCSARRKALGLACSTADGLALVTSVAGGTEPNVDKMDCKGVATLFVAAAGAKALLNNRTGTHDANSMAKPASSTTAVAALTPAALNAANKAFWDKMNAGAPK